MKKTLKILIMIIGFICALSLYSTVNAATATIKSSSSTVNVGKSVTVTVNANAAAWNLKVSGEANDTIVGMNMDGANQAVKKTYTITPKKAGKYTVYLKGI